MKIAYQGIEGSYSESCAKEIYPDCKTIPCKTFDEVFTKEKNASCHFKEEISARSFINKEGELTDIITKSISDSTGRNEKPELATDGGTSDARFIKNYCETTELGIRNQTLHQINEFVYLKIYALNA